VRANIDDHVRRWGTFRGERGRRFAALDGDIRRAAMLLGPGVSGFGSLSQWSTDLIDAAYLFELSVWSRAADCFPLGSIRNTIGHSLAADRTLPALPPMLIADRSKTNCSVCGMSVTWEGGTTCDRPGLETPLGRGCGVVWTHYTIRAWLAELAGWVGPNCEVRKRMEPLDGLPHLQWIDP
jgi:hypothetical protein